MKSMFFIIFNLFFINLFNHNTSSIEINYHDSTTKKTDKFSFEPSNWKGVNYPLALTGYTKKKLSQTDFDYAAKAGANVIRLSVHAGNDTLFVNADKSVKNLQISAGISHLKEAVAMAKNANIKIIIDMHSMPGRENGQIWSDKKYWDILTNLWTTVASVFKDDTTVVGYDLMNEPNIKSVFEAGSGDVNRMFKKKWDMPESWKGTARDYYFQMTNIIRSIRKVDANHYVIVEGFGYLGNPINFNWMRPIQGFDKVVYSFHMYIPTGLTMLGTNSSKAKGKDEKVEPFDLSKDEQKIDNALAPVLAFQQKYNVPIYVGEFGVTDKAIWDKAANGVPYNGACWLSTVIKKMDQYKWGWTYWDFWTNKRKPDSEQDPRYIILSAAMKGEPIPEYCK